jgi:SOS response regulatory protein OraA/RecX
MPKELREEALNELPENDGTLERLIRARLRNPSDRDEIRKVSAAMVRRGFSWDEIRRALQNVQCEIFNEE